MLFIEIICKVAEITSPAKYFLIFFLFYLLLLIAMEIYFAIAANISNVNVMVVTVLTRP
jgi:hypothetical protein